MPAGRPRKPTSLHVIQGTYRADRHRGEWQPGGEPTKPKGLPQAASELWESIVPMLVAGGMATAADTPALTALCEWWGRYRQATEALDRTPLDRELTRTASLAWREFDRLAARFGLTPADRARLHLPNKRVSEIESFARKRC